jgi:hypothetical protein
MHKLTVSLLPILLPACQLDAKNIGTPEPASSESTEDGPTAVSDPSDATLATTQPATGESTEDDPTEVGDSSDATLATSETSTSGSSDPLTGTEPGDSETGGEQCVAPDPATRAEFAVLLDAWPDQFDLEHNFTHDCTIDEVTDDGTTVTTALTCDVDGVPRGATVTISAAPEGDVDWGPGLSVTLDSQYYDTDDAEDINLHMAISGDPDAVLLHAARGYGDSVPGLEQIGPIARERVAECVVSSFPDLEKTIYQLAYTLTDGPSVSIWSGHRASLAIDDTHAFVIDLDHSSHVESHGGEHGLVRRVKL